MPAKPQHDQWATWLFQRRHGGDPELLRHQLEALAPIRDKVIANAALAPGNTVLDVGCGDGLIAFAAAEAVDAVTLRSVLIYEPEKATAFAEFYRVLRPGGRLSLFEPINHSAKPFGGYDISPVAELAARVRKIYNAIQPAESDPMRNFDERDLVEFAEQAGFDKVHLQLTIDVRSSPPLSWTAMLNIAANPRLPTLAEAMRQALTPEEAECLSAHLQPLVEQGRGRQRISVCYLSAVRS